MKKLASAGSHPQLALALGVCNVDDNASIQKIWTGLGRGLIST